MPPPGEALRGSEMPVAFEQQPLLNTVAGVFRHCLVHIRGFQIVGVRFSGYAIRPPWGDGDHEPAIGSNGSIGPGGRAARFVLGLDRRVWFCGDR